MSINLLLTYIRNIFSHVPCGHWVVMAGLALMVFLLARRRCPFYGAISLGLAVFIGLFLMDAAVGVRYWGFYNHSSGVSLKFDFDRLFKSAAQRRVESFSNIAVFVPFGFFLSEFMSSTERFGTGSRIGLVTMAAFGLSLLIESLQLVLHVGFFELTDLLMNTLGGFFGVCLSLLGRVALRRFRKTG